MNEQQERSAFEAELFGMYEFYSDRPHFERYTDGDYIDSRTHKFWRIWQARAALAANEKQPSRATDIATALALPGCERLRDFAAVGPVQRAAVEEFAYALAANVPAGYKLVPVVPTPEMLHCAEMWDDGFPGAWSRALAAAPAPEADHFPAAGKLVEVAPAQAKQPRPFGGGSLPTSAAERHLRRLLAVRVGMPHTYFDDGEAQGNEHGISIDFMREPVEHIDAKLRALNVARAECAKPEAQHPDTQDAERYRWLLKNYARGDGYTAIDKALNDGEPDTQLSPAIDAARGIGASGEGKSCA